MLLAFSWALVVNPMLRSHIAQEVYHVDGNDPRCQRILRFMVRSILLLYYGVNEREAEYVNEHIITTWKGQ